MKSVRRIPPLCALLLVGTVSCSDPAAQRREADAAPAAQPNPPQQGGDTSSDPHAGSMTTIGPTPEEQLAASPFKLQAPDAGVPEFPGSATITIVEGYTAATNGVAVPAVVTIEVGGTGGPQGGPYYGAGFRFSITPDRLFTSTSYASTTTLEGDGGQADWDPVAVTAFPDESARQLVAGAQLTIERGQGTLTGSLVTNTPSGTVTFGGLYRIRCVALQSHTPVAEGNLEPRPNDLVIDEGFVSPFCKPFVPLATGSLGGSSVIGAY